MFLNRSLIAKSSLDLVAKALSRSPGSLAKKSFDTFIRRPNLFVSSAAAPLCGVPKKNSALVLKLMLLKFGSFVLIIRAYITCQNIAILAVFSWAHTSFTTRPPMLWQMKTNGLFETYCDVCEPVSALSRSISRTGNVALSFLNRASKFVAWSWIPIRFLAARNLIFAS